MEILTDDGKHANPRAASVRIGADTVSGYSGQRRHDLRIGPQPAYVDGERTDLNRVLIAAPEPATMREIAMTRRALRPTQRAMKSNAAIATAGIITFGSEAAQMFDRLSPEQQDQAFLDLARAVAKRLGTSLHGLVIHLDEATIHAHFTLCAYNMEGVPLSNATRPAVLSELQDMTAAIMQRYCPEIERGTRYGDRIAAGADWSDVIHKSVKELHRELPADLAAKRAALAELAAEEDASQEPACFVFDFAPTRALRQLSEYGIGLSPNEGNPENAVKELVSFLPVLAYNGAVMKQLDTGEILDIAMAGTSATLLARKWESALLVNVDNDTLRKLMDNPDAMKAVEQIEGWRALGDNVIETIINKSEKIKDLKAKAKERDLTAKEKKELSEEEKEYKSKRKLVQEKLIKFATRIPAFMYLTDFRENTLQDVITRLEPDLFLTVTGLTVQDFHLLVQLKVFNTEQMNQAVFAFRRYEDSSLSYTGITSHEGLSVYGLYDTVLPKNL